MGVEAIRGILGHPDLELAAIEVYSDDKVGRDAGDLVSPDLIGVTAAKHVDTADVDAVLYAPRHADVDEAAAILASGANLVTTAFAFHPGRDGAARA